MKIVSSEGIIIDRYNTNEADLMVTIFSESFGKIKTLLKGVRKSKKREQAALDVLVKSKFILIKKEEYYTVSKFELLDNFEAIKKNLSKIYITMYVLEILNRSMLEGERDRKIYRLTIKTLEYLEKENVFWREALCISYFLFKVVEHMGLLDLNHRKFFQNLEEKTSVGQELINNIFSDKMRENIKILEELEDSEAEKEVFQFIYDIEKYINEQADIGLNLKKYLLG
ncbi:MAG: DNA repair protein RecO [Fusobacteriaceae bacterium]